MSEDNTLPDSDIPKKSKKLTILAALLGIFGTSVGYYSTWSGLILNKETASASELSKSTNTHLDDVSYIELEPLVVSLSDKSSSRHLKFRASLEVPAGSEEAITKVLPRVADVLNSYLRAIEPNDLEGPAALIKFRSHLLRRIQVVTGEWPVNDLLILEFVLT